MRTDTEQRKEENNIPSQNNLKINNNKENLDLTIIDAITDRKGSDITIVDMSKIENAPLTRFIITQGSSKTNVAAIADRIREKVQEDLDLKPYNYDGYNASEWIVIDYGDVLVHIFIPEARERYRLEELWSDAEIIRDAESLILNQ